MVKKQATIKEERSIRMAKLLRAFGDAALREYGTYSYQAGYLESTVQSMFLDLTKAQQEYWIEVFANARVLKVEA